MLLRPNELDFIAAASQLQYVLLSGLFIWSNLLAETDPTLILCYHLLATRPLRWLYANTNWSHDLLQHTLQSNAPPAICRARSTLHTSSAAKYLNTHTKCLVGTKRRTDNCSTNFKLNSTMARTFIVLAFARLPHHMPHVRPLCFGRRCPAKDYHEQFFSI